MEYALELLKKITPKNLIDGMTNMEWRYRKRQECLSQRSETLFSQILKTSEGKAVKIAQQDLSPVLYLKLHYS